VGAHVPGGRQTNHHINVRYVDGHPLLRCAGYRYLDRQTVRTEGIARLDLPTALLDGVDRAAEPAIAVHNDGLKQLLSGQRGARKRDRDRAASEQYTYRSHKIPPDP